MGLCVLLGVGCSDNGGTLPPADSGPDSAVQDLGVADLGAMDLGRDMSVPADLGVVDMTAEDLGVDLGAADLGATDGGPALNCGADGVSCGDGYYCDVAELPGTPTVYPCPGEGTPGSCVVSPNYPSDPSSCSPVESSVCGCDGVTYDSDCDAFAHGTDIRTYGACASTDDCTVTGCDPGDYCSFCFAGYACIPEGAIC